MTLSKSKGIVLHKHTTIIMSTKIIATRQYPVHIQISPVCLMQHRQILCCWTVWEALPQLSQKISFFCLFFGLFVSGQNPVSFHALHLLIKTLQSIFPGGTVGKNPPANVRDMGRSLVWEDSTCCKATKPVRHTTESAHLEPVLHNERSHHSEKATHSAGESPRKATETKHSQNK